MLTFHLSFAGNSLSISGVTFAEFEKVLPLVKAILDAPNAAAQAELDSLARELKQDVDKEAADAAANTPKP